MVSYFNELRREGLAVELAVIQGAVLRLRPVLITASVAALGLVPMLFATGPGSEIQKPLAAVVIGGLISSTLLTLFYSANALQCLRTQVVPCFGRSTARAAFDEGTGYCIVIRSDATSQTFPPSARSSVRSLSVAIGSRDILNELRRCL